MAPYARSVVFLWAIALIEPWRVARHAPPALGVTGASPSLARHGSLIASSMRRQVRALRLGRDGERAVGQILDGLRENGARIFHDVPAEGFNLDHVVISTHGIYVVETKTITKPASDAKVIYDGERVTVAGLYARPRSGTAGHGRGELAGRPAEPIDRTRLPVRGVVVYPRWWIEQTNKTAFRGVGAGAEGAAQIHRERAGSIAPEDVALAAFHLSRYVRGAGRQK